MELKLASLGHISLGGSKFKANSSRHKTMSYKRLKEKERELTAEIDELIKKASRWDAEEDQACKDRTGYELPADLKRKMVVKPSIKSQTQKVVIFNRL